MRIAEHIDAYWGLCPSVEHEAARTALSRDEQARVRKAVARGERVPDPASARYAVAYAEHKLRRSRSAAERQRTLVFVVLVMGALIVMDQVDGDGWGGTIVGLIGLAAVLPSLLRLPARMERLQLALATSRPHAQIPDPDNQRPAHRHPLAVALTIAGMALLVVAVHVAYFAAEGTWPPPWRGAFLMAAFFSGAVVILRRIDRPGDGPPPRPIPSASEG